MTRMSQKMNRSIGSSARVAVVLVALAILPLTATAQEIRVETDIPPMDEITGLVSSGGIIQLTLEDAIRIALQRNLGLVVERYRLSEADYDVEGNFGIYDLNATADLLAWEEKSPQASSLDGAEVQIQENQRLDLGLARMFSTGGSGSLSFNNSRFESNSRFAAVNPSFRLDFDVSFSQPLLRNRGRDATERGLRVARINRDISRENFELQVTSTIQQVEEAYWNLVEARESFLVAEESLSLAQQLHEQNKIRVEVGTLAPLDLVQSEAGIATRQEQLIRAEGAIGDAEDRLRQLLNVPADERWDTPFEAVTEVETERTDIDVHEAMASAIERRPELRSQDLTLRNLEQEVDYFGNQKLPRMDIAATWGYNGLGGDVADVDFFTGEISNVRRGGYGDAVQQITDTSFDGWSVSLNVAYPIQNRFAKAQSALAEVTLERGKAQKRDLELAIKTEVRRLTRFVQVAEQALDSARVSRRLEEKNLEAEQKRYDNGMSTSFQVLQIQEDLTEARQREVNALTGLRKALVLFYQATGELVEKSGVEIVEAASAVAAEEEAPSAE